MMRLKVIYANMCDKIECVVDGRHTMQYLYNAFKNFLTEHNYYQYSELNTHYMHDWMYMSFGQMWQLALICSFLEEHLKFIPRTQSRKTTTPIYTSCFTLLGRPKVSVVWYNTLSSCFIGTKLLSECRSGTAEAELTMCRRWVNV